MSLNLSLNNVPTSKGDAYISLWEIAETLNGVEVALFANHMGPVSYTHLTLPTICSV